MNMKAVKSGYSFNLFSEKELSDIFSERDGAVGGAWA